MRYPSLANTNVPVNLDEVAGEWYAAIVAGMFPPRLRKRLGWTVPGGTVSICRVTTWRMFILFRWTAYP